MFSGIIATTILNAVWGAIVGFFMQFWGWIIGGAGALLAFLFSPTIRKYTIAVICLAALMVGSYIYGFSSNHHVITETITHSCSEFSKLLVKGPATDKAISIFAKHHLCV